MNTDPRDCYKNEPHGYILNSSGLYQPKSTIPEPENQAGASGDTQRSPFFVNVVRDPVAFFVSLLTLIFLAVAASVSIMQIQDTQSMVGIADRANRLTRRSMESQRLNSLEESNRAQQALQTTIDNFHTEQRAWVGVNNVETVRGVDSSVLSH